MDDKIIYSFKRYEKKYCLNREQLQLFIEKISPYMKKDKFGRYTIENIYYDTDDWQLVRASIEKPVYKEKLRIRSYGMPANDDNIFVEIKKKYKGVVYKRRISTAPDAAERFLSQGISVPEYGQIGREIAWFQSFYRTKPKIFIGYDRMAFAGIEDPDLRITFDSNLRYRTYDLDLRLGDYGMHVLAPDEFIMEIKVCGACPLWLCRVISEVGARQISFSKIGCCYKKILGGNSCA